MYVARVEYLNVEFCARLSLQKSPILLHSLFMHEPFQFTLKALNTLLYLQYILILRLNFTFISAHERRNSFCTAS